MEIESVLMSRLGQEKGFSMPLYVLQKTNLVTKDFIRWFYKAMNGIVEHHNEINVLPNNVKVGLCNMDVDKEHTFIYRLFMDDAVKYKLCLGYALIVYVTSSKTMDLDSWMRVWRNLILNSSISSDSFVNALNTIESYSGIDILKVMQKCCSDSNFVAKGFSGIQINEEAKKAKLLALPEWEKPIYVAESCYIFKGAIRNLFEHLEFDAEESLDSFISRSAKALSYFEPTENNKYYNADLKTFKAELICALISQCDWQELWELYICRSKSDWRENITNYKLHSALLSFWDMDVINKDQIANSTWNKSDDQKQASVFKDLCSTELVGESIKACGASVYLHHIETEHFGFKYYITSFNAKADWKKYFIGTERNRIISSLMGNYY